MNVTEQINNFVRLNGGNERDALNVALARLDAAEARADALNNENMDLRASLSDEILAQLKFDLNEAQINIKVMAEHNTKISAERDELRRQLEQTQAACRLAYRAIVLGNGREIDWNSIADQLMSAQS